MTLTWEDPPNPRPEAARERSREIDAHVVKLQENPGQWALVVPDSRGGRGKPYVVRGCQVRYVEIQRSPRRFNIYARWPQDEVVELWEVRVRIPASVHVSTKELLFDCIAEAVSEWDEGAASRQEHDGVYDTDVSAGLVGEA